MAKTPDLKKLSDEDLEAEAFRLTAEKDAIREQQLAVNEEMSQRAAERLAAVEPTLGDVAVRVDG